MKITRITLLSSLSLALFACAGDDDTPAGEAPADGAVENDTLELAPVSWRNCGALGDRDIRCAEIAVPVDHADPGGPTLEIAINRIAADPSVAYRGVLFVNPGGPGQTGKDYAQYLAASGTTDVLAPGFDVVGFDPRGVGDSGERACGPAPTMMTAPDTLEDFIDGMWAEAARCERAWGPLFERLGSNQVVRDMEALRVALGEPALNFLGISYGTRLGSLYAHTFPETAGSMVLDSSMTPDMDLVSVTRQRFAQLLALQEVFFQDCEAGVLVCPPNARDLFDDMLAAANEVGMQPQMADRWANALAYVGSREELPFLLERQAAEPGPEWIVDELSQPGLFSGLAEVASRTVTCIDATTEPPSLAQIGDLYNEFAAQSPVFALRAYAALQCTGWPVTRDPVPLPSAPTASPLLVIGGSFDLLTPLSNAEEMAAALGNATLLVSNHYGHGAIDAAGACVGAAIRNYFERGELPPQGTVCEP